MQAQMVTGFFKYEPCELSVEGRAMCVNFPHDSRQINIDDVKGAAFTRMKNGGGRMEITTESEQYEFLLSAGQADEQAVEMLYELTKGCARLELRTQDT